MTKKGNIVRKVAIATRGEEVNNWIKAVQAVERNSTKVMDGEKILGTVVANARTKILKMKIHMEKITNDGRILYSLGYMLGVYILV